MMMNKRGAYLDNGRKRSLPRWWAKEEPASTMSKRGACLRSSHSPPQNEQKRRGRLATWEGRAEALQTTSMVSKRVACLGSSHTPPRHEQKKRGRSATWVLHSISTIYLCWSLANPTTDPLLDIGPSVMSRVEAKGAGRCWLAFATWYRHHGSTTTCRAMINDILIVDQVGWPHSPLLEMCISIAPLLPPLTHTRLSTTPAFTTWSPLLPRSGPPKADGSIKVTWCGPPSPTTTSQVEANSTTQSGWFGILANAFIPPPSAIAMTWPKWMNHPRLPRAPILWPPEAQRDGEGRRKGTCFSHWADFANAREDLHLGHHAIL